MKFIKPFLESSNHDLYRVVNSEEFIKILENQIDMSYLDFSELSEFFNTNHPHIDYHRGFNRRDSSRLAFGKTYIQDHFRNNDINEDNCFVFKFRRILESYIESMVIILKTEDNYFLVYDLSIANYQMTGGAAGLGVKSFFWTSKSEMNASQSWMPPPFLFICDDIDGLISFLGDGLSYLNEKYTPDTQPLIKNQLPGYYKIYNHKKRK